MAYDRADMARRKGARQPVVDPTLGSVACRVYGVYCQLVVGAVQQYPAHDVICRKAHQRRVWHRRIRHEEVRMQRDGFGEHLLVRARVGGGMKNAVAPV